MVTPPHDCGRKAHAARFGRDRTAGTRIAVRDLLLSLSEEEQMRRTLIGFLAGALLIAATNTSAQERVPHAGSTAVGVDVGAFVPVADQFDDSLLVNVLYEYYVNPRLSFWIRLGEPIL
jgi:hypothetical protein